jgi:hypothetical protein
MDTPAVPTQLELFSTQETQVNDNNSQDGADRFYTEEELEKGRRFLDRMEQVRQLRRGTLFSGTTAG